MTVNDNDARENAVHFERACFVCGDDISVSKMGTLVL